MVRIEKLWKQWNKNKDEAFREKLLQEIWNTYYPKLTVYINNIINEDADTVSDIVRDILIRIFENIHIYNSEFRFSTWIYSVARNHVTDIIRNSIKSGIDYHPDECFQLIPDHKINIEGDLILKEETASLENNIKDLGKADRELIYLRYYEKLKYSEISELTSIPVGTIKNRIFLIKKKLFQKIAIKQNMEN